MPLSPIGDVSAVTTLKWTAVPGAEVYRVTLFDKVGKLLFEMESPDTMTLPIRSAWTQARIYGRWRHGSGGNVGCRRS
jgi:hypothetical protein